MATAPALNAEALEGDRRISPLVAIGQLGNPGRCQAWMDAADRQCSKATDGYLCTRHRTVAAKRLDAAVATARQDRAKRAAARQAEAERARAHLQSNRDELARVSAELDRLTTPVAADRAAVGGSVHPSIIKRLDAQFSESRSRKISRLTDRRAWLEQQITLAES